MAFIPVPNTADVVLEFMLAGVPISIVLSAKKGGSITISNLFNLGTAIIDGIYGWGSGAFIQGATALSLVNIKLTDLTTASSPSVNQVMGTSANLPYMGATGANYLPAQASSIITWTTALRGRSFRGRSYYAGLERSMLASPDTISTASVGSFAAFWDAIHAAINGAEASSWTHVIVSRHAGGVPRTTGVATPVTGSRMNQGLATQRRRVQPTG